MNAFSTSTIPTIDNLDISSLERGRVHRFWVTLGENGLGRPIVVPVLVAHGRREGPVVGVTAALHGNELNGIPTIHRLFQTLDPDEIKGSVVGVPVVNSPGYLLNQREFNDDSDLNRRFPGRAGGNTGQVYAHRFLHRIATRFEYLIDLHTASFGRVNSLYVRADMTNKVTATMARLVNPHIIVHNKGGDGTLRSAAEDHGIHAITIEIGDPQLFQQSLIRSSRMGILAVLDHLDVFDDDVEHTFEPAIECVSSFWIYADHGGILTVHPPLGKRIERGSQIATLTNLFGDVICSYTAPEDGVVIGKSTNPVAQTGARILHLGRVGQIDGTARHDEALKEES
ncbi:MAG: succinylglutamate desuccinylase/aspartoacylase family protein [Planctomycetes bacterium]|nr:succinylglutamate desuccinylase/aspartoacylase family protein [Planctomycetota bacterium]